MECELHIAKTSGLLVELGGTMKDVIFLLMAALCFATVSSADEIHPGPNEIHHSATCNASFSHGTMLFAVLPVVFDLNFGRVVCKAHDLTPVTVIIGDQSSACTSKY